MKRTVEVERNTCDFCSSDEECHDQCRLCGKYVCHGCEESVSVEYKHGIHFSGSRDGRYCNECDAQAEDDPLHQAYKRIAELLKEESAWYADFQQRSEVAEAAVNRLWTRRIEDGSK